MGRAPRAHLGRERTRHRRTRATQGRSVSVPRTTRRCAQLSRGRRTSHRQTPLLDSPARPCAVSRSRSAYPPAHSPGFRGSPAGYRSGAVYADLAALPCPDPMSGSGSLHGLASGGDHHGHEAQGVHRVRQRESPVGARRIQVVVATMGFSGSDSSRCMACAGVIPPSVLRGRWLSSVATSSSLSGE